MDDYLKEALDIVKAQASVRIMAEDEIISMVRRLSSDIKNVAEGESCVEELVSADVQSDPRKSIKEKSITCLECGKTFKILTRKHLASHGLDAVEYREKWGLKKDTPLVCKGLQRERRKKMKDMKLWEKRRKVEE
ncbi:MucR family transcriptional regulator [uncultured Bilophila sp.]|uniref:MucR family transcriptional regulator n=1 Tax=uncultured Bilophila sp. TaxID=529385 RepID=UPI0025D01763|nr:MucR family transcriptional regulator [uncultured Bilophila sp.]